MISRAQLLKEQIYQAPAAGLGSLSLNKDLARAFGDHSANSDWHTKNDLNLGAQSGNMQLSGIYEADQNEREAKDAKQGAVNRQIRTSHVSNIISDNFYGDNYNNFNGFSDIAVTKDTTFGYDGTNSDIVIREDGMLVDANGMHITAEQHAKLETVLQQTTAGVTAEAQASRDVLADLEHRDSNDSLTQEEILEFPPHVQEALKGNASSTVEDARNASLSKLPEHEAAVGGYFVSHDAPTPVEHATIENIEISKIPQEVLQKLTGKSNPTNEEIGSTNYEDVVNALENYGSNLDENGKYSLNTADNSNQLAQANTPSSSALAAPQL